MEICFEGVGQAVATFLTEADLTAGQAVALTGSSTVGLGESGALPCGVTVGAERNGAVAVQIAGAVTVGYSGETAPTVGYCALTCDGRGMLARAEDSGLTCLVLAVDETARTVTVKL